MPDLAQQIASAATDAVDTAEALAGGMLDYSESSLAIVEEVLEQLARARDELNEKQLNTIAQEFGCYILEVGRRAFGGRYCWFDQREQPVLVVGEPAFRVSMIAWDKVRGRLAGDKADNIPFFYAGFAERARQAKPGDDALYV
jgi:hypothetical protein